MNYPAKVIVKQRMKMDPEYAYIQSVKRPSIFVKKPSIIDLKPDINGKLDKLKLDKLHRHDRLSRANSSFSNNSGNSQN